MTTSLYYRDAMGTTTIETDGGLGQTVGAIIPTLLPDGVTSAKVLLFDWGSGFSYTESTIGIFATDAEARAEAEALWRGEEDDDDDE